VSDSIRNPLWRTRFPSLMICCSTGECHGRSGDAGGRCANTGVAVIRIRSEHFHANTRRVAPSSRIHHDSGRSSVTSVKIRTRVPWTHPYGAKSDDKWEESTLIACCSPRSLRLTQRARLGAQRWSFSPIQISSRPGSVPHAPYREFKVGLCKSAHYNAPRRSRRPRRRTHRSRESESLPLIATTFRRHNKQRKLPEWLQRSR
jgi:hypothetical protein